MTNVTPNHRIINSVAKYVEVLAVPGSGKTHTLIQRLNWLINEGVHTNKIHVLSFSNTTVNEIEKRIKREANLIANKVGGAYLLDSNANTQLSNITVQTAHTYANTIINTKQKVLTDKSAATLVKEAIQLACKDCNAGVLWANVSLAVKQRRLTKLKHLIHPIQIKQLLQLNSYVQASGQTVLEVITARFTDLVGYENAVTAVIKRYSRLKQRRRVIDYGDMLTRAIAALDNSITAVVPYTHILVDEYQDCSHAQTQFLARLATRTGCNLMVFGDKNQAIYSFTGAGYTSLSDVLDGVKELGLPVSRRLTAQIAALASAVTNLTGDDVIQTQREGEKPVLVIDKSLKRQTQHAVQHIARLIKSGVAANKIAVLARTKALLHPVEALLLAKQVNTARNGVVRNRKHVIRVLHLMHILERSLEKSTKITPNMLQKVVRQVKVSDAILKRESLALKRAAKTKSIDGRYKQCAKIYLRLMGGIRAYPEIRDDVNRYEAFSRGHADARAIRDAIRASNPIAVITGTIHSAKGGEWDHVLIVGVTDGLLPIHYVRDDNEQAMSEERNLLYVAITRARLSLRLFHAPANNPSNHKRYKDVCKFLDTAAVRKTIDIVK